ncbi:MAG: hypothetical protein V3S78_00320 [Hyphomicrobium sp.]
MTTIQKRVAVKMGGCPERPKWPHCYVENSGLCHGCGKPMNLDYWAADRGYFTVESVDQHGAEWAALMTQWETKYGKEKSDGHGNKRRS